MKDRPWPVEVRIGSDVVSAALMNGKSFLKSRESGVPWLVHPRTGRVLPWPGEPVFADLEEGRGRYVLRLPEGCLPDPYGEGIPEVPDPEEHESANRTVSVGDTTVSADPLKRLSDVISRRNRERPEGSYTTHLFEKGIDKIRKKTGEEAVELLLARDRQDVIYESADLIYHLLVLLEAEDLGWEDVKEELFRREG